jgi:UDP-galactose transporter B1
VFLNTVQSSFATIAGYIYLLLSRKSESKYIFPTTKIVIPLFLVSVTSTLASPFGYASLKHIDYITFILAKSCKLLPVMALHLTLFRKRYPLYKYAVVAAVTAGVAIFTLHQPISSKKASKGNDRSSSWGLFLLSVNLLFDGLTNSTQDYIFQTFKGYSGPQMMCAQNLISTAMSATYLISAPYLSTTAVGAWLGMTTGELHEAVSFVQRYPTAGRDVLLFSACGAVGQIFICKGFSLTSSFQYWLEERAPKRALSSQSQPHLQTPGDLFRENLLDYFDFVGPFYAGHVLNPWSKKFNSAQYKGAFRIFLRHLL